jgi:putative endonuclease
MFRRKGLHFERIAELMLQRAGLHSVARNFTCRAGEIDLIMDDHGILVFVEVRFRASNEFGDPLETITKAKQRRLIRAANFYLQRHPHYLERACRFDAIGISGPDANQEVRWIKDAFSA